MKKYQNRCDTGHSSKYLSLTHTVNAAALIKLHNFIVYFYFYCTLFNCLFHCFSIYLNVRLHIFIGDMRR